jgi:hypothetical protein
LELVILFWFISEKPLFFRLYHNYWLIPECDLARQRQIANVISEELVALQDDMRMIEKRREEIIRRVEAVVATTAHA